MKYRNLINFTIKENEQEYFTKEIIKKNIFRGGLYCEFVIFIELILCLIDISSSFYIDGTGFKFSSYLLMYLLMIIVNFAFLVFTKIIKIASSNINIIKMVIISYVIFMMSWGAIISLMDQRLYGQLMVFMVNVIACSVIYYLDNKAILYSYFISTALLFLGLPFFQKSMDVLIGHYVNSIIFLLLTWIASRVLFLSFYNDFISKRLVIEANEKLTKEIQENKSMHNKLEIINKKLMRLSLIDELTKLNNRRGLRKFVDNIFISDLEEQVAVSIIMMDIDEFKLYNDNYGHVAGDEVLKKIATLLNEVLGDLTYSENYLARYGGEEFIYIAVGCDENEICLIGNKIREKIYNSKITHEYSKITNYLTISLGTATVIPHSIDSIYQGIKNADSALYQAKAEGKNRVIKFVASN